MKSSGVCVGGCALGKISLGKQGGIQYCSSLFHLVLNVDMIQLSRHHKGKAGRIVEKIPLIITASYENTYLWTSCYMRKINHFLFSRYSWVLCYMQPNLHSTDLIIRHLEIIKEDDIITLILQVVL